MVNTCFAPSPALPPLDFASGFDLGSSTPDMLVVKAAGFAIAGGLYKRVPGSQLNGESIWCNGVWRLYSGRKGFWLLSGSDADMQKCQGYVRSSTPHLGTSPDRITEWQVHTPAGWEDCSIAVGSASDDLDDDDHTDTEGTLGAPPSEPITSFADSPDIVPDTDIFRLESDMSDADFEKFKATLTPLSAAQPYQSPTLSEVSDNPRTLLHFLQTPPAKRVRTMKPTPAQTEVEDLPAGCNLMGCVSQ